MPTVPLLGGAYQTRSLMSSAQEAINLYAERNPEDGQPSVPVTSYPTPGLELRSAPPYIEAMRSLYRSSNGKLYCVIGPNVYAVSNTFAFTLLGTLPDNTTPVWFADNGQVAIVVDGSATGYAIDIANNTYAVITDPSFYGGTSVTYQDGYFILNRPDTNQFYISLANVTYAMLTGASGRILSGSIAAGGTGYVDGSYSNVALTGGTGSGARGNFTVAGGIVTAVTLTAPGSGYAQFDVLGVNNADLGGTGSGFGYSADEVATAFDPLDIAAKSGSADNIVAAPTVHSELWLIGELTTEVWYNSGAADFAYQRIQGAYIDHGCAAPYSIAQVDTSLLWLSQDRQGDCIVVMTDGYGVKRVSPHALEQEFQQYRVINDAIGYVYQIEGHAFYVLTFPTQDRTYSYDLTTQQWHRWSSIDGNGVFHRHRSNCFAYAYGYSLVGDYQNGNLYALSTAAFTDNGVPIPRVRTFPHMVQDGRRVLFRNLQANMATGQQIGGNSANAPKIYLSWSDDKGFSFGNAVAQSMGATGQYITSPQWNRLGYARDRVFKLQWSVNADTALQGVFVNYDTAST